jgi:ketol-acid reductoisomerase
MSSRSFSKALRPLARQLASPAAQRRTFIAAAGAVRASAVAARAAAAPAQQQVRGVKTIDFAGSKEDVYGELIWINWLAATNC